MFEGFDLGQGYAKKAKHNKQLPLLQYQSWYWLFAFVHNELLENYVNEGFDVANAPQAKKFANHNAMHLANMELKEPVEKTFSEHFRQVAAPIKLTELLIEYLKRTSPPKHQHCCGFQGLTWPHVTKLSSMCAAAVHLFATVLPDLPVFGAKLSAD